MRTSGLLLSVLAVVTSASACSVVSSVTGFGTSRGGGSSDSGRESDSDGLTASAWGRQLENAQENAPKLAEAPAAAEGAPTWCDGVDTTERYWPSVSISSATDESGVKTLAKFACKYPKEKRAQHVVAIWRGAYQAASGLSDEEFLFTMRAFVEPNAPGFSRADICGDKLASDRDRSDSLKYLFECQIPANYEVVSNDPIILPKSQVVIAARLKDQLDRISTSEDYIYGAVAKMTLYDLEAKRFDKNKYFAELKAMKLNPLAWWRLRVDQSDKSDVTNKHAAVKAALSADAELVPVVAAGKKAYEAWVAEAATIKPELAELEAWKIKTASGSKKAIAGCVAAMQPMVAKSIAARKSKSDDDTFASTHSVLAGNAFRVIYGCESVGDDWNLKIAMYQIAGQNGRDFRGGPRLDAIEAMTTVAKELASDNERYRKLLSNVDTHRFSSPTSEGSLFKAVVKSVSVKGDLAVIEFKTEKRRETTYACKDTRRIERIMDNGTIIYKRDCRPNGSETVDATHSTISIPAALAAGIAAGQLLEGVARYPNDGKGAVIVTRAKNGKLASMFGVAL